MAYQPETPEYHAGIYQLEKIDLVEGGVDGKSNLPLKQLTDRTAYLKQSIDALESGGGPFEYNASAGTLPVGGSDGPGVAGIRRKDYYFVTVPGVVSGVTLQIGDALIAMVDDADHISEFIVSQTNAELATPSVIGMVKLVQNLTGGSQADACLSVAGLITLFAQKAGPAFTGNATSETPVAGDNSLRIANTAWVLARLVTLSDSITDAIEAESIARENADNSIINNIDTEILARQNGDSDEAAARAAGDNSLNSSKADKSITISPGAGLNGGGNLSANRTLGIANGGVGSTQLADGAVTAGKIANGEVTAAKLASDVIDLTRGSGSRSVNLVDFTAFTNVSNKTYTRALWTLSRNSDRLRAYVKAQVQLQRADGGSEYVQFQLQRNPNPDGGGSWSTIHTRTYRLDDASWTTCIVDTVDTDATPGDNYYRLIATVTSGGSSLMSDDISYLIFGVPHY
jgi:hypothetical protein